MRKKHFIDEIDIERAANDPDYRRQVLGLLNAMSVDDTAPKTEKTEAEAEKSPDKD